MAGTAPFYLSSHFNNVTHEYFTRGSMYDLDVPMPNREIFRQSIVYQGAVAWNGLDDDMKCCNSITSLNTCINLAHACNGHYTFSYILFTNVILV